MGVHARMARTRRFGHVPHAPYTSMDVYKRVQQAPQQHALRCIHNKNCGRAISAIRCTTTFFLVPIKSAHAKCTSRGERCHCVSQRDCSAVMAWSSGMPIAVYLVFLDGWTTYNMHGFPPVKGASRWGAILPRMHVCACLWLLAHDDHSWMPS